jgi:hypothetical protein
MRKNHSTDPIVSADAELALRVEALDHFWHRVEHLVPFLYGQIDAELAQENTAFVLSLLGAAAKLYDRKQIPHLTKLARRKEADLAFRIQSLLLLTELYRKSVDDEQSALAFGSGPPLEDSNQFGGSLAVSAEEYFTIIGAALTKHDRDHIEAIVHALAEDAAQSTPLRFEAQRAWRRIEELRPG